ncbi:ATP-binding protein [Pseudoruegeria sp. HB172150]|uniref:ATP-binding protein n=1 Tax=Pseudoruegeria sp. HB172150 TaxID=2721164 RepID=UPI0015522A27|nr:ATP-binding protein [Pseudoruegeria sp. HB172150]
MNRLGLTGRLILFIALGMFLTQALVLAVYLIDRQDTLPGRHIFPAADQMEATVRLFDNAGPEERDLLARAFFGSGLVLRHGVDPEEEIRGRQILPRLTAGFSQYSDFMAGHEVRLTAPESTRFDWFPGARAWISPGRLQLLVQLSDETWLSVGRRLTPGLSLAGLPVGMVSALLATLLALIVMIVVWRETRPLRRLAEAAESFGRDLEPRTIPLPRAPDLRAMVLAFDDMQHRIARADRNRTDMLIALSHDVRTPLARLTLRLRKLDPELQEAAGRDITQIERVADAAFQLAQADGPSLDDKVDLRALLADLAEEAGIPLVDGKPDAPAEAQGNGQLLGRAVANLIDNALKYGATPRVVLVPGRQWHTVAVEDDGPGIPMEERERLLQPFQHGNIARGGNADGDGLGLALTRRIVERHGGALNLGDTPSGGMRAAFTLPANR